MSYATEKIAGLRLGTVVFDIIILRIRKRVIGAKRL
jgi:hypothetical protein